MKCNFTSFSTVFQPYQDNRKVIMKGGVQGPPLMVKKISISSGNRTKDR